MSTTSDPTKCNDQCRLTGNIRLYCEMAGAVHYPETDHVCDFSVTRPSDNRTVIGVVSWRWE